jgi:hypothetical protein
LRDAFIGAFPLPQKAPWAGYDGWESVPFLREGRKQGKMRTHFKLWRAVGMLAIGVISAGTASAALLPSGLLIDNVTVTPGPNPVANPGFETTPPDLTRWTTLGNTAALAGDYKANPEGALQAAISSSNSPSAVLGTTGVASTNIAFGDTFFGLAANSLESRGAQTISGITQAVTLAAGQAVSFQYDFLTNEAAGGNPDFAFFSVKGPTGAALFTVLGTPTNPLLVPTSSLDGVSSNFNRETGYSGPTLSFTALSAGTYTLGFGVSDATGSAVPLPPVALGGMALCGGLGLMQIARRRKQMAL